jgi:hypothetical protein
MLLAGGAIRPRPKIAKCASLVFEALETRLELSGVEFLTHPPVGQNEIASPSGVMAADVDNDRDLDVLAVSDERQMTWHENLDGAGTFGPPRPVVTDARFFVSFDIADLDGDGDLDVLSASYGPPEGARYEYKLAWSENLDGKGRFGERLTIATAAYGFISVEAADIDGDGYVDVVSAYRGENDIVWHRNREGTGNFSRRSGIVNTRAALASTLRAADVDRDGDLDVLFGSKFGDNNRVAWHENLDGAGSFGPERIVTSRAGGVVSLDVSDMDGDGDADVITASWYADEIAWYENTNGAGAFGPKKIVASQVDVPISVHAVDMDNDGDQDVLSASRDDDTVAWYENADGNGTFGPPRIITATADFVRAAFPADVDGDGDLDVLYASSQHDRKIAWHANTDGIGTFRPQKVIATSLAGPSSVFAADVDSDGDLDVLSASYEDWKIAWFENLDSRGTFGPQRVITTGAFSASSVAGADLDNDGALDVISATSPFFGAGELAWYRNADGRGEFESPRVVGPGRSVHLADIDGDGDIDVMTTNYSRESLAGGVYWYENTDTLGTFERRDPWVVQSQRTFQYSAHLADMDGDGDTDAMSAAWSRDGTIAWYENTDGQGHFGPQQLIGPRGGIALEAADVDGDGHSDVIASLLPTEYLGPHSIVWYKKMPGARGFQMQPIIIHDTGPVFSLSTADVDDDGDVDLLVAFYDRNVISWFENIDGLGTFGPEQVIAEGATGTRTISAADVEGDGDPDILSASTRQIDWYENVPLAPPWQPGDANKDCRFDQRDVVQVLQAGKLLTGQPASWGEGDWDGNGMFDRLDIVVALQTGNYLEARYAGCDR